MQSSENYYANVLNKEYEFSDKNGFWNKVMDCVWCEPNETEFIAIFEELYKSNPKKAFYFIDYAITYSIGYSNERFLDFFYDLIYYKFEHQIKLKENHGALKNLCKNVISYENFKCLNKFQKNNVNFRKMRFKNIPIQFLVNLSKLSLPMHLLRDISFMNHASLIIFSQLMSTLNGNKISGQINVKNNGQSFIDLLINNTNIFSYCINQVFFKDIENHKFDVDEPITINIDCKLIYHFKDDKLEIFDITIKDKEFEKIQIQKLIISSYNLFRF